MAVVAVVHLQGQRPQPQMKNSHAYRLRAEECRAIASEIADQHAKAIFLNIASDYEFLAVHAENQERIELKSPDFSNVVSAMRIIAKNFLKEA